MIRQCLVAVTLLLAAAADADRHPYAFERPLASSSAYITHRVGVPFVHRTDQEAEPASSVDTDSDEFNDENVPERDRASSGEVEIRSRILRNMTLPGQQRKNATNATVASPVEAGNAARPSEDLMTSEARLPVALSLKGKRDRLKNHNVGTSKPRPKPVIEYDDDDEYYYVYDDEYYDVALPPRKLPSHRKHKDNKNKKPSYPAKFSSRKEEEWEMTSAPLYSPATISPLSAIRPARQGLAATPSSRPVFSVNKKFLGSGLGKSDRKSDDLSGLDGSHRMKVEEYAEEEEDEYYDDFEVVENKGKRRSDGYGDDGGGINPLALLIAPLVGISLLTAAVAVALNPVLVSISLTGRRRRRSAMPADQLQPEVQQKVHEMQILERFLGTIPDNAHYQQTIMSMYLSCSGFADNGNKCLDRVVCEYSNPESTISQEERDVVSIVLYNIMANQLIGEDFKDRLRTSAKLGRDLQDCSRLFQCPELESLTGAVDNGVASNSTKKDD